MKLKKICTIILACLMISGCLVGCGSEETTTEQVTTQSTKVTEEVTTEDEGVPLVELPEADYDYEFRILMRKSSLMQADMFADGTEGDAISNAVYTRNLSLLDTYGVALTLIESSSGGDDWDGLEVILSGTDAYDLVAPHGRRCATYAVNGCCVDWYDLPYLNLSYDWWAQGARESFTFNDTLLYMTGDLSHLSVAASYVIVFNKDILTAHGYEYPYQSVKDGTWTFEQMSEMALACCSGLDDDGEISLNSNTDVLGYITYPWGGTYCALFASGTRIVSRDQDGMPVVTIASETAYNALVKFYDLVNSTGCYMDLNDYNSQYVPAVVANRVTFYDTTLNGVAIDLRQTDLNYGIVPYPKTADVDSYSSHVAGSFNVFLVPVTEPNLERTSVILEYLAQEGHNTVIPVYYDKIVTAKSVKDQESYEMLSYISASRLYDFGYFDIELEGISNLLEQLSKKHQSAETFYSDYQQNLSVAQQHLLDLVELYSQY